MRIVVDANIAFRSLLRDRGDLRTRLAPGDYQFLAPRYLFVELFKHKERLAEAAQLREEQILDALYALTTRLIFINETNIPIGVWVEAYKICKEVDEKDTPYVALALHMDAELWTEDLDLRRGLRERGFTSFFHG